MKRKILYFLMVIVIVILYLVSGIVLHPDNDDDRMTALKGPFSRLTQTVNSARRYKKVPPNLNDMDIIKFATASNPILLSPFEKFVIRIKPIGSETVLLLCTSDNQHPLLEDISSTHDVDKERWRTMEIGSGCDFTITKIP